MCSSSLLVLAFMLYDLDLRSSIPLHLMIPCLVNHLTSFAFGGTNGPTTTSEGHRAFHNTKTIASRLKHQTRSAQLKGWLAIRILHFPTTSFTQT